MSLSRLHFYWSPSYVLLLCLVFLEDNVLMIVNRVVLLLCDLPWKTVVYSICISKKNILYFFSKKQAYDFQFWVAIVRGGVEALFRAVLAQGDSSCCCLRDLGGCHPYRHCCWSSGRKAPPPQRRMPSPPMPSFTQRRSYEQTHHRCLIMCLKYDTTTDPPLPNPIPHLFSWFC